MALDLLAGEESEHHARVFPGASQVPGPRGRAGRRRRRPGQPPPPPPPLDWDDVFEAEEPLLRRGAAAACASRVRVDRLAALLPSLVVHESAARTVQMMSRVQPLGSVHGLEWSRPWRERNATGAELLLRHAANDDSSDASEPAVRPPWLYYFSSLDALGAPARDELASACTPSAWGSPFGRHVETDVWAGVGGVRSPLHYDAAHNVYVQLAGTKRFVLFGAGAWRHVYVYPRLHPSTRQSQLDLRAVPAWPDFARFHRARESGALRAMEVVLAPGDVLYIPPYVWHRASVVGAATSLSLAVYTHSTALDAYDIFKSAPLPWPTSADRPTRLAFARAFVAALSALAPPHLGVTDADDTSFACTALGRCACAEVAADEAAGDGEAQAGARAIDELLELRYSHLHLDASVVGYARVRDAASDAFAELTSAARRAAETRGAAWPELRTAEAARVRSLARSLAERVRTMQLRGAPLSADAWRMEVDSLIEDIAAATVGAERAEHFLRWAAAI